MIITDEETLKYRTALQVERDYLAEELGVFAEDLRTMLKEMKDQGRKPEYSQEVKNYGLSVIERLANAHLELQYPDYWPAESLQASSRIAEAIGRYIFPLAEKSKEVIETMVQVTAPGQIEKSFAQIHAEIKNPAQSAPVRASVSTVPPPNVPFASTKPVFRQMPEPAPEVEKILSEPLPTAPPPQPATTPTKLPKSPPSRPPAPTNQTK